MTATIKRIKLSRFQRARLFLAYAIIGGSFLYLQKIEKIIARVQRRKGGKYFD